MAIHPPPPPPTISGLGVGLVFKHMWTQKARTGILVYMYMYIVIRYLSKVQIKGRITLCIVTYQLYDCVHVHMYRKYIRCSIILSPRFWHLFSWSQCHIRPKGGNSVWLSTVKSGVFSLLFIFIYFNTFSYRHSIRDDII